MASSNSVCAAAGFSTGFVKTLLDIYGAGGGLVAQLCLILATP